MFILIVVGVVKKDFGAGCEAVMFEFYWDRKQRSENDGSLLSLANKDAFQPIETSYFIMSSGSSRSFRPRQSKPRVT